MGLNEPRATPARLQAPLCWYLILTKPSAEEKAKINLERQGFRVYFPQLLEKKLYRSRWRDRITALFPRYLFLQVDTGRQSLATVRSTLGVADAVRFGSGGYAVVPEQVVGGLMQQADPGTGLHRLSRSLFLPGAAVRVIAGAFAGLEAIFERQIGEDRVMVLLNLLGRDASIRIAAHCVVPHEYV